MWGSEAGTHCVKFRVYRLHHGHLPIPGAHSPRGANFMNITELLIAELAREAAGSRKTLERVPEGKNDWKPHQRSMPLGYLATIVASIPSWLDMVVNMDELDVNPPQGPKVKPQAWRTRNDLLEQFESSLKKGRAALERTTDDRLLNTTWRTVAAGKLMSEQTRYIAVRDYVLNRYGTSPRPTDRLSQAERRESAWIYRSLSG